MPRLPARAAAMSCSVGSVVLPVAGLVSGSITLVWKASTRSTRVFSPSDSSGRSMSKTDSWSRSSTSCERTSSALTDRKSSRSSPAAALAVIWTWVGCDRLAQDRTSWASASGIDASNPGTTADTPKVPVRTASATPSPGSAITCTPNRSPKLAGSSSGTRMDASAVCVPGSLSLTATPAWASSVSDAASRSTPRKPSRPVPATSPSTRRLLTRSASALLALGVRKKPLESTPKPKSRLTSAATSSAPVRSTWPPSTSALRSRSTMPVSWLLTTLTLKNRSDVPSPSRSAVLSVTLPATASRLSSASRSAVAVAIEPPAPTWPRSSPPASKMRSSSDVALSICTVPVPPTCDTVRNGRSFGRTASTSSPFSAPASDWPSRPARLTPPSTCPSPSCSDAARSCRPAAIASMVWATVTVSVGVSMPVQLTFCTPDWPKASTTVIWCDPEPAAAPATTPLSLVTRTPAAVVRRNSIWSVPRPPATVMPPATPMAPRTASTTMRSLPPRPSTTIDSIDASGTLRLALAGLAWPSRYWKTSSNAGCAALRSSWMTSLPPVPRRVRTAGCDSVWLAFGNTQAPRPSVPTRATSSAPVIRSTVVTIALGMPAPYSTQLPLATRRNTPPSPPTTTTRVAPTCSTAMRCRVLAPGRASRLAVS